MSARKGLFDVGLSQKGLFDREISQKGLFDADFLDTSTGASCALTGSIIGATEDDIVAGSKTTIDTLNGDTWIAAGALSFDLARQDIINGYLSAQSELLGWNNVVRALQSVSGVVRTSDTVVTITWDAQPTYNITATETITFTAPASALTGGVAIVASPTFTVTAVTSVVARRGWSIRVGSRAA